MSDSLFLPPGPSLICPFSLSLLCPSAAPPPALLRPPRRPSSASSSRLLPPPHSPSLSELGASARDAGTAGAAGRREGRTRQGRCRSVERWPWRRRWWWLLEEGEEREEEPKKFVCRNYLAMEMRWRHRSLEAFVKHS
jgi:hypothetical protein